MFVDAGLTVFAGAFGVKVARLFLGTDGKTWPVGSDEGHLEQGSLWFSAGDEEVSRGLLDDHLGMSIPAILVELASALLVVLAVMRTHFLIGRLIITPLALDFMLTEYLSSGIG